MKLAVSAAVVAVVAISGCGGGSGGTKNKEQGTKSQALRPISIAGFKFKPETITVAKGTKVTWKNVDNAEHTATDPKRAFDTGAIKKGASKTLTLSKPGTYAYICDFHPFMKATIIVK